MSGPARRILIVEDEWLIADFLSALLEEAGYETIGPAPSVERALAVLSQETPDAAILDVMLGREKSYPVAEALTTRNIPFVFTTGYLTSELPEKFAARPIVSKPVEANRLRKVLEGWFGNSGDGHTNDSASNTDRD
jgi:CheY-like chemotaxis protein